MTINSFNGKSKRHSIIREFLDFLKGAKEMDVSFIPGEIVSCKKKPVEPVEIRRYSLKDRPYFVDVRCYSDDFFQKFKLCCDKSRIPEVVGYIDRYCSSKD